MTSDIMKRIFSSVLALGVAFSLLASNEAVVTGPDGRLAVTVGLESGKPYYSVSYDGQAVLLNSPLGFSSSHGDYTGGMTFVSQNQDKVRRSYVQDRIKKSFVEYEANRLIYSVDNADGHRLDIEFRVSDNDVAFRYVMKAWRSTYSAVILSEATGFAFPDGTTTFLTPQSLPMIGFARTKPSYEEVYCYDGQMDVKSQYGCGYTFPALFHVAGDKWALVSETGVTSQYVASHLSDCTDGNRYTIEFPDQREINGWGSRGAVVGLPAELPWRTVTVGDNLAPIVETTVAFDVVDPLYERGFELRPGRSTWSWIMWGDGATIYEDQVRYIDFASAMGYEYCLIDALWDVQIGRDRIEELVEYARSKNVGIFLWYNSNGSWNDAPQGPRNCFSTSIARKKEMKWLQEIGVKGLKVDFFGSDKQSMIQLYEDILSDANEYGMMVIFHGCTIPRGWERLYPNYVGSEAVLASENLMFGQRANDDEAKSACTHPFIRNASGAMEFGGSALNKRWSRDNQHGNYRRTTDAFELATAVIFQNPVQNFALAPNNLYDVPAFEISFMKNVPTTWDDVKFIDGYPGRFCIMARRHGSRWYLCGINAEKAPMKVEIDLAAVGLPLGECHIISDGKDRNALEQTFVPKNGILKLEMQPDGGFVAEL